MGCKPMPRGSVQVLLRYLLDDVSEAFVLSTSRRSWSGGISSIFPLSRRTEAWSLWTAFGSKIKMFSGDMSGVWPGM